MNRVKWGVVFLIVLSISSVGNGKVVCMGGDGPTPHSSTSPTNLKHSPIPLKTVENPQDFIFLALPRKRLFIVAVAIRSEALTYILAMTPEWMKAGDLSPG